MASKRKGVFSKVKSASPRTKKEKVCEDEMTQKYLLFDYNWKEPQGEYVCVIGRGSFSGYSMVVSSKVVTSAKWISIGKGVWKLLDKEETRLLCI